MDFFATLFSYPFSGDQSTGAALSGSSSASKMSLKYNLMCNNNKIVETGD